MRKLPRMQHTDLKSVEESEEKWGREYEVPTYILHKVRRKNGDKVDGPIQWEKMVIFFKFDQMHGLHIEGFH